MSSKAKHIQRSHKTHKKNYSEYRSFMFKVSQNSQSKDQKKSFAERIKALLTRKHQDR
jgi:FtsZ-binding cell division protein ZapB